VGTPGYWSSIYFTSSASASSVLDSCFIRYGGSPNFNGADAAVHINGSTPSITRCEFGRNRHSLWVRTPGVTLTDNEFSEDSYFPVRLTPMMVEPFVNNNYYYPHSSGQYNAIYVEQGVITDSTVWPALPDSFVYYLPAADNYSLYVNGLSTPELRIEPGAIVKLGEPFDCGFDCEAESYLQIGQGILTARGVYFTAATDDSLGGDSNGGGASVGAPGYWSSIYFTSSASASSVLDSCFIRYGGNANNNNADAAVYINNSSASITRCQFNANRTNIRVEGGNPPISDNNLSGYTGYGIWLDIPILNHNVTGNVIAGGGSYQAVLDPMAVEHFVNNNNFYPHSSGQYNAIYVEQGVITASTVWPALPDSFVYYLPAADPYSVYVHGSSTPELRIEPGAIIKLNAPFDCGFDCEAESYLQIGQGILTAQGVYFTAATDDSLGGDSNGGGASVGTPGYWSSIYFTSSASASSVLDSCFIRYGGSPNFNGADAAVYVLGGGPSIVRAEFQQNGIGLRAASTSPTIIQSSFRHNQTGLWLQGMAAPDIISAEFDNNSSYGILAQTGDTTVVHDSRFHSNGIAAIRNTSTSASVVAKYNWWGDVTGPKDATPISTGPPDYNPLALGDSVSDYVYYRPWQRYPGEQIVPYAPELSFSNTTGFVDDGVSPDTGMATTEFEFRVVYSDDNDDAPAAGYPRVKIDLDGNGTIETPAEGSYAMWSVDADETYADGKEYFIRTYLPQGNSIKYAFEANDSTGLVGTGATAWYAGPYVSNQLNDLAIRAVDITFADGHPDAFEPVTIFASVTNNSPISHSDVLAYLYISDSLVDSTVAPLVNTGIGDKLFQFSYTFPQDYFYSVRVVIDPHNTTGDWNLLNNSAARGLLVGEYVFAGGIELNVFCPAEVQAGHSVPFSFEAHYYGLGFSDSIPVSGATVTYRVVETGSPITTTYTNDAGTGRAQFLAPGTPSNFTLEVTLTDYTITRTERIPFVTISPPVCELPDTVSVSEINIDLCGAFMARGTRQPFRTTSDICPSATVTNAGSSDLLNVGVGVYFDGLLLDSLRTIPLLQADSPLEIPVVQLPTPITVGEHNVTIRIDPLHMLQECDVTDNVKQSTFRVWPDTDLAMVGIGHSPSRPNVYDTVTFSATVRNVGYFDVGPVVVAFVDITAGNIELGSDTVAVIAKQGGEGSFSLRTIAFPQGCRQVKAVADPLSAIAEYDELNNSLVTAFCVDTLLPDLEVTYANFGLTDPDMSASGANGLYAIVSNLGNETAEGAVVRFYEDGIQVGTDVIVNSAPGARDSVSVPYFLDLACHTLAVRVDPLNQLLEQREDNNFTSGKVPYEIAVDHIAYCPSLFESFTMFSKCNVQVVGSGQASVTVWARLRNTGLLTTPLFSPTLTDTVYAPDSIYSLSALSLSHHGGTAAVSKSVNFTASDVGSHTFIWTAMAGGPAQECDATNNSYMGSLQVDTLVPFPDFTVDLVAQETCIPLSEQALLDITVRNLGTAPSSATKVVIYRDGTPVDSLTVGALEAGASRLIADDRLVSVGGIGSTVLSGRIDVAGSISEFDESNNYDQVNLTVVPDALDFALLGVGFSNNSPATIDTVTVSATVRNDGALSLGGNLRVAFYFPEYDSTLYDTLTSLDGCFDQAVGRVRFVFSQPGSNCVRVTVDPDSLFAEYTRANDTGSACLSVKEPLPDLWITASDIRYTNESPAQGSPVYVDVTVHNGGSIGTVSEVQIYIGGAKLGDDTLVSVAAGGVTTVRSTVPWTANRITAQSIYAIVDSTHQVTETDEGNNSASICAVPELEFLSADICPEWNSERTLVSHCPAIVGTSERISVHLTNTGAMNLQTGVWAVVRDSFDLSATLIDSVFVTPFGTHGADTALHVFHTFDSTDVGGHTILIDVDGAADERECNDSNSIDFLLTVADTADIPVDLYAHSEFVDISNVHPAVGDAVYVSTTVYNGSPYTALNVGIRFLLDESPLGVDVLIDSVPGTASGMNYALATATLPWEAIDLPTPLHVVRVIADPADAVLETDEDNNEATRSIVVGDIPDLAVSVFNHLTEDSCASIGEHVPISMQLKNNGLVDGSGELVLRQVRENGDTVTLDTRSIFLESLSNRYEDYSVLVNQEYMYLIFEFTDVFPEDYIPGNNRIVVSWDRCPIIMTGDVNVTGAINSADIIYLVGYVFKGGPPPHPCVRSGDVNCSGSISAADIIYLVNYVFKGGPPPCDACSL
jgi:subtilase family serine protease